MSLCSSRTTGDSHPGPLPSKTLTLLHVYSVQLDPGFPGAPAFAPFLVPLLLPSLAHLGSRVLRLASTWGRGRRTSRTQTLAAGEQVNRMRKLSSQGEVGVGVGRNPLSSCYHASHPFSGRPPKSSHLQKEPLGLASSPALQHLLPQSASSGCSPRPP